MESISPKIGCVPCTLLGWAQGHEIDTGVRDGVTKAEAQRVKEREREGRELHWAKVRLPSNFEAHSSASGNTGR